MLGANRWRILAPNRSVLPIVSYYLKLLSLYIIIHFNNSLTSPAVARALALRLPPLSEHACCLPQVNDPYTYYPH